MFWQQQLKNRTTFSREGAVGEGGKQNQRTWIPIGATT